MKICTFSHKGIVTHFSHLEDYQYSLKEKIKFQLHVSVLQKLLPWGQEGQSPVSFKPH